MVNVTCQHKQTQQHSPINSVYAVSLVLNSSHFHIVRTS